MLPPILQHARPLLLSIALFAAALPSSAAADAPPAAPGGPVTAPEGNARSLALAVRAAVDEAEADLSQMPFFVRPMARSGFSKRTGLSFGDWKDRLNTLRADDTPVTVKARWPDVQAALGRLADNFRTAPERAKKGMGGNPDVLRIVEEKSKARAAATQALLDWLRR